MCKTELSKLNIKQAKLFGLYPETINLQGFALISPKTAFRLINLHRVQYHGTATRICNLFTSLSVSLVYHLLSALPAQYGHKAANPRCCKFVAVGPVGNNNNNNDRLTAFDPGQPG